MANYRVTAPLVLLKVIDQAGKAQFNGFYAGAVLPSSIADADQDNLRRHLDRGWVEELDEPVDEPAPEPADASAPTPPLDPDAVPSGTAAEVLAWVDNDQARAGRALVVEQTAEKPRTTLIADLTKVAEQQA